MRSTAILVPLFALAAWTGCMLALLAVRRLRAGFRGQLPPRAFRIGEDPGIPDPVLLPNRNFMNLLELPILFYVICIIAFAAGQVTAATLTLAWIFVACRVVHSLIHVTYNRVGHRFAAFVASNAALLLLWVVAGVDIFGGARGG